MENPKKPRRVFETLGVDWTSKPPRVVGLVREVDDEDPQASIVKEPEAADGMDVDDEE